MEFTKNYASRPPVTGITINLSAVEAKDFYDFLSDLKKKSEAFNNWMTGPKFHKLLGEELGIK
jgi:hypothetical protein